MNPNPSDFAVEIYAEMAALAARFELRARLVADLSHRSRKAALKGTLDDVLMRIKGLVPLAATASEWSRLDLARQVRNKLLHCELHQVARLVKAPGGNLRKIEFDGPASIESLERGISNAKEVSALSTKEAGIVGWVLEFGTSGGDALVKDLFRECLDILSRVTEAMSRHETKPR